MHQPSARIPEERVATILARAAEIDRSTRETISLDDVRAAALDAGISPAAVDQALDEYVAGPFAWDDAAAVLASAVGRAAPPRDSRLRRWLRAIKRPVKHGLVAVAVGLLVAAPGAGNEPLVIAAVAGWLAWCGRNLLRARPSRRAAPYVLSTALTTLGGAFGFAMLNGDEDVLATVLALGLVALPPLGAAVIKIRLPRRLARMRESRARAG